MIVSYREKRTETFAAGRRVPAFSGIEPAARFEARPTGSGNLA